MAVTVTIIITPRWKQDLGNFGTFSIFQALLLTELNGSQCIPYYSWKDTCRTECSRQQKLKWVILEVRRKNDTNFITHRCSGCSPTTVIG